MRFYLDTEFIADSQTKTIDLLSVGLVSQDGREFYAVNSDCNTSKASVLGCITNSMPACDIKTELMLFVGPNRGVEFWGDSCAYDYVALSLLFGDGEWPDNWPLYFNDVRQLASSLDASLPNCVTKSANPHNSLDNARAVQLAWFYLNAITHPAIDTSHLSYVNHTAGWIRPHKIRHFL